MACGLGVDFVEKAKDGNSPKIGRPLREIDWEQVNKLCLIQCTQQEIADILRCHVQTLETAAQRDHSISFTEYYKIHCAQGKASLRRQMFKSAMKGNPAMQIWLSKQYLGMKENWNLPENIAPIVLSYKPTNQELPPEDSPQVIDIPASERIMDDATQEGEESSEREHQEGNEGG